MWGEQWKEAVEVCKVLIPGNDENEGNPSKVASMTTELSPHVRCVDWRRRHGGILWIR